MNRSILETLSRLTEPIRQWGSGVVSGYVKPTMQKVREAIVPQNQPQQEMVSPLQEPTPTPTRDPFLDKGWEQTGPNQYAWPTSTPTPTQAPSPGMMPQNLAGYSPLQGFVPPSPEQYLLDLILAASEEYGINPSLLAALLYQESEQFNPDVISGQKLGPMGEWGIGQVYPPAHPEVTQEQAFDPAWAVPWTAQKLSGDIGYFDDVNRGLAAYNVGRGGASVAGQEPFGGGPKGQEYINNVSRNLLMELINELGLKTSL